MDTEDKWGKETNPAYSINLAALESTSLIMPANRINTNFTLEFWAIGTGSSAVTMAGYAKIDFEKNILVTKSGSRPIQSKDEINWSSWNHFALSNSNKNGLKLFVNAALACHEPVFFEAGFKVDTELVKVHECRSSRFEVTEIRLWSISLN